HAKTEIVSRDPQGVIHRSNYGEVAARAKRVANALVKLGVGHGDRVATLAWNSWRHLELYYGVTCSGRVLHTVNPRLFQEQIVYIIDHADDGYVFFDLDFVGLVEQLAPHLPKVKGWVALCDARDLPAVKVGNLLCYETLLAEVSPDYVWPQFDENTACTLCYTSGTTGNPKGVLYSHRSTLLHAFAACAADGMAFSAKDSILVIVPLFHANAWSIPFSCAMCGAKLVLPGPKLDPESIYTLLEQEACTKAGGIPTIWLNFLAWLDANKGKLDLSKLKLKMIFSGGTAAPRATIQKVRDDLGIFLLHAWGMTETSPVGTFNSPSADFAALSPEDQWRQRLSVGRPVWGVEVRVVDATGQEQPWDGKTPGSLLVRGPWVCAEYFRVGRSDAHRDDGWFDTGDIATIDVRGYVTITDRAKDVIKSGGEWISSITLENTVMAHPAVAEAAVIGAPHPRWDERPLLCVVLRAGADATREELLDWFDGRVASWWVPDDVLFFDELPHTATGKLSKKDLRERLKRYRFGDGRCDTATGTSTEDPDE
ncbi:MAG: long-chain fatty acid--CoA ligase, partial [Pseudomonadales bacterium]|nr:long-chain fatty acid--CoA ligase [Pseudomonadales bacterium]